MATLSCRDVRDRFSARLDEALDDDERIGIDAHLATCGECAREWERFERTVALLRAVPAAGAPAGFVDRVMAARPRPWYRRLARGLFVPWPVKLPVEAAAIVLVAGLAVLVFQRSPDLQRVARPPAPPPEVETAPTPLKAERVPPLSEPQSTTAKEARRRVREPGGAPGASQRSVPEASRDVADAPRAAEPSGRQEAPAKGVADNVPAPKESERARATARQVPPAAPALQKSSEVRRLSTALDVHARLGVAQPDAAERAVRDLVARASGRVVSRVGDDNAVVLELALPGERWEEFQRGLQALGALRLEGPGPDTAGPVRLGLRLER
jgi:putative zinc finger protein